jgi:hypothetical protein
MGLREKIESLKSKGKISNCDDCGVEMPVPPNFSGKCWCTGCGDKRFNRCGVCHKKLKEGEDECCFGCRDERTDVV